MRTRDRRDIGGSWRRGAAALIRYVAALVLFNAIVIAGPAIARAEDTNAVPVRVLVLGDSLASGYGLPAPRAFPARLTAAMAKLGVAIKVLEGGVSGDTTDGGRNRLSWALAGKPAVVLVELGGNDGLRGLAPARTRANLDAIVKRLKAARVGILLTGMKAPPNLGREYGDEFNAIFPALAKTHGVALYPFFLEGVAARPALNQRDGIHPNAQGVEIIARRIAPVLKAVIEAHRKRQ